jgi:hypothetical protein
LIYSNVLPISTTQQEQFAHLPGSKVTIGEMRQMIIVQLVLEPPLPILMRETGKKGVKEGAIMEAAMVEVMAVMAVMAAVEVHHDQKDQALKADQRDQAPRGKRE